MTIRYEIEPVDFYCPDCDSAMVETGCESPSCSAVACLLCEQGCDIEYADNGRCAVAVHEMSYSDRLARQEECRLRAETRRPVRTVQLP